MLTRGLHTPGRYSQKLRVLAVLFAIVLLVYKFRKKVITYSSSETVYRLLLNAGLTNDLAMYMTAQAAHETGGFTSDLYKSNNNCFGMKYAKQINSIGEKNGYANYSSVAQSVNDLVAWYTRHRNSIFSLPLYISSLASYVRFLKNNSYFEADETEYLKGCQYFYDLIF